jgi:hypothetical protein
LITVDQEILFQQDLRKRQIAILIGSNALHSILKVVDDSHQ